MVKLVIFVTILALACVNAQFDFGNPETMLGDIWNHPMFQKMDLRIPSPKDLMKNMKPGPNQEFHSRFVSQTSENGKVITTIQSNDNGKKKEIVVTK